MDELDLTQEELDAMVALGVVPEKMQENRRQRELAELMRYGKGSEGREAGRTYVAANPLEHLRDGIQRYQARKEMKGLDKERGGMIDQMTRARGMYGDLLRGKGQLSAVGNPPMGPPQVSPPQNFPMPQVQSLGPQMGGGMPPMRPQAATPGINPNAPPPGAGGGMPPMAVGQPGGQMPPVPGGYPFPPKGVVPIPEMVKKQALLAQLLRQQRAQ